MAPLNCKKFSIMALMLEFYKLIQLYQEVLCNQLLIEWHKQKAVEYSEQAASVMNIVVLKLKIRRRRRHNPFLRTIWVKPKNENWWKCVVPTFDDYTWKEHFRISRLVFNTIVECMQSCFSRQDTAFRKCIPIKKKVAMSLYAMGSTSELRTVAQLFGVGKSTLCQCLHEFCREVITHLTPIYIKFPTSVETLQNSMEGFLKNWRFPQCFGVIDSCHIPISPPKQYSLDYYNCKGWHSTVLLAVCNSKYIFSYINVGSPGRNNDAYIFRRSSLYSHLKNSKVVADLQLCKTINGEVIPPCILGDSAFPMTHNLLKPFPECLNMTDQQCKFNYHHAETRKVISNTFVRLKARFQILTKRIEFYVKNVPNLLKTICTLHNMCENIGDAIEDSWLHFASLPETQPDHSCLIDNTDKIANNIRLALANYFEQI